MAKKESGESSWSDVYSAVESFLTSHPEDLKDPTDQLATQALAENIPDVIVSKFALRER